MGKYSLKVVLVFVCVVTLGCSSGEGFSDLDRYVEKVKSKPKKRIEPLPKFAAYEAFSYRAANRKSPFAEPEIVEQKAVEQKPRSNVKPDFERPKGPLEFFAVGSMDMVGTIVKEDEKILYALISDSQGGIHRVKLGDYIGKNHGKIVAVSEGLIQLVEIVSDGQGGWFERPRVLGLRNN